MSALDSKKLSSLKHDTKLEITEIRKAVKFNELMQLKSLFSRFNFNMEEKDAEG